MSRYDISTSKLAIQLLPVCLRRPAMAAMASAMTSPIGSSLMRLNQYRLTVNYRLTHNGQVCYLRSVLNDTFDPIERRINIDDSELQDGCIIYSRNQNRWAIVPSRLSGSLTINGRNFSGVNGIDFNVKVPSSIVPKDSEAFIKRMSALVKTYKLASKRFIIQIV